MARRSLEVDGERWVVYPSGRVSPYGRDEFGLVFELGTGSQRIRRVTRFRPIGAQRRDVALMALSDAALRDLFATAQPSWTSPETGYASRRTAPQE